MNVRRLAATVPVLALSAYVLVLPPAPSQGAEEAQRFHRTATYPVYKNLPADVSASSATVAEISDVSPDGKTLVYTDALGKRIGFLDISDPANPQGDGSLSLAQLGDTTDEPTSVAVAGKYVLVVVNTSKSFTEPSGRLDVVRLSDAKRIRSIDLQGQPDSIDLNAAGTRGIVAIENERDETFAPSGKAAGDLPQLPAGFVQVLDLQGDVSSWSATKVPFTNTDGSALASFSAAGFVEPTDPEPEYVSVNGQDEAVVALQENNGLAVVDLETREITKAFTAGTASVSGIDTAKDGTIDQTGSISNVRREPDAVQWVDDTHVATANEGDWKGGTRGWTVFDTGTGDVVWDAGSELEELAVRTGVHNEDRAAKKGVEIEGLAVATIDGTRYAFVGSERSNFVAVYDIDDAAHPVYRQVLPATNGPEGILPIPSRNLLAVSSETDDAAKGVRASVGLYELGDEGYDFPTIESDDLDGKPIGWSALGALTADPTDPKTLYTASDTVLTKGRIFTVDVSGTPARITHETVVKDGAGTAVPLDVEGLFARPGGGFWLASEGATGAGNKLVRTDAAGIVQQTVPLPSDIAGHVGKWGFEGVTATTDASGDEHVWTVVQRPLWKVPTAATLDDYEGDDIARIGRYDVSDGSWHWYGYRLSSPLRGTADWMGLSEITAIDHDTFAVIERDKLNGPAARVKRIYTVDVPADEDGLAGLDGALPVLDKKLAIDVLPELRATKGWTQEKLEGFTVAADGSLYGVTDNDGLTDATGETVFLRLGRATEAFADALATETTLGATPSTWAFGKAPAVEVAVTGEHAKGSVTLLDGTKKVATRTLEDGAVSIPLGSLAPGTHRLTARFASGPLAGASTSAVRTVKVTKAASSTSFSADDHSVRKGQKVGFSVKVTANGTTPTGRVQVLRGKTVVKTLLLSKAKASVRLPQTKAGTFTYTVKYLGSATVAPSTSKGQKVTVR